MPISKRPVLLFVCTCLFVLRTEAEIRLPALFSDHAVLQQGRPIPIWGSAEDGEVVTVSFRGAKYETTADHGKWRLMLPALTPGGPDLLTISGKNKIELKDVLVGEVWICSGQSNMEFPLRAAVGAAEAIDAAANPKLRLFTVPKLKSELPVDDVKAAWQESGPQTVTNFSAVAFYFGRDLQKALGVPVGLIHTSWGGSPAEVWVRHGVLENNSAYARDILSAYSNALGNYEAALARFTKAQDEARSDNKPFSQKPPQKPFWKPSELYNGMIAPLLPFAIRGAIWYQGESNASRAKEYRTLFPDMIGNWRQDWGQGDFPFLAVQLAPWDMGRKRSLEEITATPTESDWAELREAQVNTTRVLPNTGLAVITDVGDKDDIHPRNKAPVGARLALLARGIAYRQKMVFSGPIFRELDLRGSEAIVRFDFAGTGLEARDGDLTGFAVAGPDGKFVWAKARIDGPETIVVSSPSVPHPVAVRYGWADFPVVNLWNKDGLPASPFRSDEYPPIHKK